MMEVFAMVQKSTPTLADLYEADETAWLDAMAELIRHGRVADLDYPHLMEYLEDMAKRDRREVSSRMAILIVHVLKWIHQSEKRTKSWQRTVVVQRQELARILQSGTLRNHAEAVLAEAYADAVEQAAAETGLEEETFPATCPWTLDQLLSPDILKEDK
jgi:hypothetical protein